MVGVYNDKMQKLSTVRCRVTWDKRHPNLVLRHQRVQVIHKRRRWTVALLLGPHGYYFIFSNLFPQRFI